MSDRDDFSEEVKRRLADRVSSRCSAPGCARGTKGPSATRAKGVNVTGVAAHITAAAVGGPRYDATLTAVERSGYDNGIWLCQNHGTLVDGDHDRYSTTLLEDWKMAAESRARLDQESGFLPFGHFFDHGAVVTNPKNPEDAVCNFLEDVGGALVFPEPTYTAIWRLLGELARNSFLHGQAQEVCLTASRNVLTLGQMGAPFSWEDLGGAAEPGGGVMALRGARASLAGVVAFIHRYDPEARENEWSIINMATEVPSGPCIATLSNLELEADLMVRLSGCEEVHLHLPTRIMLSDIRREVLRSHPQLREASNLVVHGLAEGDYLRDFISEWLPNARVV
jgi:hypothetical protein